MATKAFFFLSMLVTAIAMSAGMAHLFELRNKIRLSREDYLTVQQIYRGWALAGFAVVGALTSTIILSFLIPKSSTAFSLTVAAAICIALSLVVFFLYTFPANRTTNKRTVLPDNWQHLRHEPIIVETRSFIFLTPEAPMCRYAVLICAGLFPTLAACTSPSAPTLLEHAEHSEMISGPRVNSNVLAGEPSGATSRFLEIGFFRSADCTDEIVEITGTIHLLFHEQADGSWMGQSNYQRVTAVGLTSGMEYRVTGTEHFRLQAPFPSSIEQQGSFRLISKGGDSNLLVHTLFHVTVTANGEITAAFDSLNMKCQ